MTSKTVSGTDVDQLFVDIERIIDLYTKAGADEDDLSDRWIKVLRNLSDSTVKLDAVELKKADRIEETHSIINTLVRPQNRIPQRATGTESIHY